MDAQINNMNKMNEQKNKNGSVYFWGSGGRVEIQKDDDEKHD